jgi:1-acyl-sn-glycerol-3-phosphate acyltransferase
MDPVYRPVVGATLAVFRLMGWDVRTTGTQHIPRRGAAVIAANHVGYLDFAFLGVGAHRRGRLVRFMAMKEAFGHWLGGPLLRGMKHIPVDREGDAGASLHPALRALQGGEVVGIHPEGGMSRSFVPAPGKSGAARLAMQSGAPLIPAAVWGSQRILSPGHRPRWPRDVVVTVAFGQPIEPGSNTTEVTASLMGSIGELVARAAEDYPQHPRNRGDRWWLPAHLGGTAPTVEQGLALSAVASARRRAQRAAASDRKAPEPR